MSKSSKYKILGVGHGYSENSYIIQLFNGEWDTDENLINFCDDCNFGGRVEPTPDKYIKKVVVYID